MQLHPSVPQSCLSRASPSYWSQSPPCCLWVVSAGPSIDGSGLTVAFVTKATGNQNDSEGQCKQVYCEASETRGHWRLRTQVVIQGNSIQNKRVKKEELKKEERGRREWKTAGLSKPGTATTWSAILIVWQLFLRASNNYISQLQSDYLYFNRLWHELN